LTTSALISACAGVTAIVAATAAEASHRDSVVMDQSVS